MTTAIGAYATASVIKAQLGIADSADDTVLGNVCDRINGYIELRTRRVLAPVGSATFLIDVEETGRRHFDFPRGIRAVSDLSVGTHTGATRTALASTEYFLRPLAPDRLPGWPATRVVLSDLGSLRVFPKGFEVISMTATTGWAAIPDEITEVALTAATRMWHSIQSGQADLVGTDEMGQILVSRFFSPRDLETLRTYSTDLP